MNKIELWCNFINIMGDKIGLILAHYYFLNSIDFLWEQKYRQRKLGDCLSRSNRR